MIAFKQVIHFPGTNSIEATWVDEGGNPVRCHSYDQSQMGMLRDDLGGDVTKYEILIADVLANLIPQPTIPAPVYVCSPWQIRKALNAQGLRSAIELAIAASSDQALKDGWEFATEFRSDDAFVLAMGVSLGKTEAETVQLIQYAASL